nr:short chain dehydrogenase [uncultured bacterium]
MQLNDAVVWITGGARRIGRAIALDMARRGAHLVIHYKSSEEAAKALAREAKGLGRHTLLVQGDLASKSDLDRMVSQIEGAFRGLDVLINNASIYERTPIAEVTEESWDRMLSVNLKGPFFCAQAAARLMLVEGPRPRGGRIINISDSAALRPYPNHLPYMTSKAALIAMTQAMALELAPEILVNCIAPGVVLPPVSTSPEEMIRALQHIPLGQLGSPQDIVAAINFLIEGTDYVTGQTIMVDGGRFISQPARS